MTCQHPTQPAPLVTLSPCASTTTSTCKSVAPTALSSPSMWRLHAGKNCCVSWAQTRASSVRREVLPALLLVLVKRLSPDPLCLVLSLQTLAALRVASALKARTPPLAKSAPGPSGPPVPTIAQAPKAATAQLLSRQAARRHPAPPSPRLASAQMSLVRWITRVVPRILWWQVRTLTLYSALCAYPAGINCQVSEWGSWSTCSDSCSSDDSDRQEIRHRSVEVVTQPSACPALNETRLCTPAPSCPGK